MHTHDDETAADAIIAEAYQLGADHARAAATWTTDGNQDDGHAAAVLALMRAGDPRADDYLPPTPGLSGEWADGLTPQGLALDVGAPFDESGALVDEDGEFLAAICDAYEEGVSDHFEQACESELVRAAGE